MSRLDHALEPNGGPMRRIDVITGSGERRRRWSDEEKSQAIEESFAPGAVVSVVARGAAAGGGIDAVSFTPVVVCGATRGSAGRFSVGEQIGRGSPPCDRTRY